MLQVEQEFDEPLEELLRRLFVDEGKSVKSMANELNTSYRIVFKWLKLSGIHSRNLDIKGGD